jgi:hypothetical protein
MHAYIARSRSIFVFKRTIMSRIWVCVRETKQLHAAYVEAAEATTLDPSVGAAATSLDPSVAAATSGDKFHVTALREGDEGVTDTAAVGAMVALVRDTGLGVMVDEASAACIIIRASL